MNPNARRESNNKSDYENIQSFYTFTVQDTEWGDLGQSSLWAGREDLISHQKFNFSSDGHY